MTSLECEHGRLARVCELCDAAARIAALEEECARLRKALGEFVRHVDTEEIACCTKDRCGCEPQKLYEQAKAALAPTEGSGT